MFQFGGAEGYSGPWFQYARKFEQEVTAPGAISSGATRLLHATGRARRIRLVVAGVFFDRFPRLKIYFAENQSAGFPTGSNRPTASMNESQMGRGFCSLETARPAPQ